MATAGLTPINGNEVYVALSAKSGTLAFQNHMAIARIDTPPGPAVAYISRHDVFLKGEERFKTTIPAKMR